MNILSQETNKKPDQFAENKAIMPYGDSVGAPSIHPTDLTAYKQEKVIKTNHYFESRFNEIKDEYKKLIEAKNIHDNTYFLPLFDDMSKKDTIKVAKAINNYFETK